MQHRNQPAHQPEQQESRQFNIEFQGVLHRQDKLCHVAKGQSVNHRARGRGDHNGRERMHGEVAQRQPHTPTSRAL